MINQATLKGNWNEIKGKLRSRWGQLTNDDVQAFNGNVDQLVGLIERKTGESRAAVEDFLDELTEKGSASMEDARQYVQDAAQRIQENSRQAMEAFRENYEQAERIVRRRPAESLAACFGIGVFVGLLFGLSLKGR
jgi:uncharacterized protein YjbJ (UPF0337 family)